MIFVWSRRPRAFHLDRHLGRGAPKIHRSLARDTPAQIRSEFPRALRKFCVGIDSSFCSATRRARFCVLRQEPHSSVCVERFGSVAPPPKAPHPRAGVTGATIWKIGHEHPEACASPRGEGSFSALRSGGDRNYADCEFTFADLLLSHTVASRSNV